MAQSPTQPSPSPLPPPKDPAKINIFYAIPLPLICVTPGAMLTLARNWGGLGRPAWTRWTILSALLIHAGVLLGLVITLTGSSFMVGWSLIWVFGVGNLVFWTIIRDLQKDAYRTWAKTRNSELMRQYPYRIKRNDLFIGLPLATLLVIGVILFGWVKSQPERFENDRLAITYDSTWESQPPSQFDLCADDESGCFLALTGGRLNSAVIVFVESPVTDQAGTGDNPAQPAAPWWAGASGLELLAENQIEIGSDSALSREYAYPPPAGDDSSHIHWFRVQHNQSAYEIIAWSPQSLYEDNRPKIMAIIHNIQFKS